MTLEIGGTTYPYRLPWFPIRKRLIDAYEEENAVGDADSKAAVIFAVLGACVPSILADFTQYEQRKMLRDDLMDYGEHVQHVLTERDPTLAGAGAAAGRLLVELQKSYPTAAEVQEARGNSPARTETFTESTSSEG